MSTPLNGSILKGFEILRLISAGRPEITASIVEAELGMNFTTAHRFLTSLERAGALFTVRRGVYRLSHSTAEMGRLAEITNPYVHHVQPLIEKLCRELNESVMVCRLGQDGPTCVSVALADRPITVSIRVGTTLRFPSSAQGKLWLADMKSAESAALIGRSGSVDAGKLKRELDQIRRQGYARNLGEAEPDIAAVAAPVRNARGELILTVSVFGSLSRFTPQFQQRTQERVRRVAREIERHFPQ